jgi:surface antigen
MFLVTTALAAIGVVGTAGTAHAETGGYPYASYNGPGTNPSLSTWADASGNIYSPFGYAYRNCTDFDAWKLSTANGFSLPSGIGNGANWGVWAQQHGYVVNNTPAAGAVAWWGGYTLDQGFNVGAYGHVAWVASVNADGSVNIQEYNKYVNGVPDGAFHTRTIIASGSQQVQYIHFKDLLSSPPSPPSRVPGGDVDGNGCADLVITTNEAAGFKAFSLLATCNIFLTPQQWLDGPGYGWSGVTPLTGDVNGDKKADYVFLTNEGANGTKAYVALSTGSGFLSPQQWWNGTGVMYSGVKASLGDVDGNGCKDLVVTTNEATGSKAFSLLSTCNTFLAPQQWWDGAGYSWSGITPLVGDVDGNGCADLVITTNEGANGTKAFSLLSTCNTFLSPQQWWNGTGVMYSGVKASLGDVDGNGCNDLVITTSETTGFKVLSLLATCNTFLAPQQWLDGAGYSWSGITPLVGDVNGDKKADYVFLTNEGANGTKAYVALSTGSGFLSPQQWWNGVGVLYDGVKASLG